MSDWIEWKGGNCPVSPNSRVVILTERGQEIVGRAGNYCWDILTGGGTIVSYKELEPIKAEHVNTRELDWNLPEKPKSFAELYPAYYKDISDHDEMDTYLLNMIFPVDDTSGCILHSRKKLLLAGSRTGGKEMWKDVKEARDTLSRYLQLMGHE